MSLLSDHSHFISLTHFLFFILIRMTKNWTDSSVTLSSHRVVFFLTVSFARSAPCVSIWMPDSDLRSLSLRSFQFTESSCLQSQKRQLLKLVKHHKKFEIGSIQHSCISRRPIYQFHLLSGRLTFLLFSLHVSLWSFPYRNRVLLVFDCDWCLLFVVLFPCLVVPFWRPRRRKKTYLPVVVFFSLFLLA